jgi:hypothetical protein
MKIKIVAILLVSVAILAVCEGVPSLRWDDGNNMGNYDGFQYWISIICTIWSMLILYL